MKSLRTNRPFIIFLLVTQLIPLLAFTPEVYSLSSQVWWLGAFLAVLVLISIFHLIVRGTFATWPWYLIGFAQGFNIISRMLMFFGHVTENQNGTQIMNWSYAIIGIVCMIWSAYLLSFVEYPEVKNIMIKE